MTRELLDDIEWQRRFGDPRCSGQTARGTPCPRRIASTLLLWDDRTPWPACPRHLTREQRAAWEAQQDEDNSVIEYALSQTKPACWSWPVPTEEDLEARHKTIVEEVLAFGGLTDAEKSRMVQAIDDGRDHDDALLDLFHDGRCALCGRKASKLVVDHDHDTGLIRGHLCHGCNTHEGMSHSSMLEKYRERPPAVILRIEKRYVNMRGHTPMRVATIPVSSR